MSTTPHLSAQVAAASESPAAQFLTKLSPSFDVEWSTQTIATSVLVVIVTLLIAEQTLWRYRKSTLPGHSWQIVSRALLLAPPSTRFCDHRDELTRVHA